MDDDLLKQLRESPEVHIGFKQFTRDIREGIVSFVVLAEDIDESIKLKVRVECAAKKVPVHFVPSRIQLGKAVGIEVAASVVSAVCEKQE